MSTWLDVITDALLEINAYALGDPLPPDQVQFAIRKLNRLVDQWAARKCFAYATTFSQYTLVPNLTPHTIGPSSAGSPTFVTPGTRPVRIESASLILNTSTPATDVPVNVRDAKWWARNRTKAITSSVPTDLYYEPDFALGSIYFWPVPTYAYGVRLQLWTVQGSVPLDANGNPDPTQSFSGPEGYETALLLTLAEEMATPFGRQVPPDLGQRAAKARTVIQSNNLASPRISSADYGACGSRSAGDFNYISGLPE